MPVTMHKYEKIERTNDKDYQRIIKDLREALVETNGILDKVHGLNKKLISKTKRYA